MTRTLGRAAAAIAALSLASAPAFAAEGAAAKLSLRSSTASEHDSDAAPGVVIGLIGVAAIVAGGVVIATEDDHPDSN